jgi:hypothetical protein
MKIESLYHIEGTILTKSQWSVSVLADTIENKWLWLYFLMIGACVQVNLNNSSMDKHLFRKVVKQNQSRVEQVKATGVADT